jgi:DeoR family glycerol-3-phosphate regulon repressor
MVNKGRPRLKPDARRDRILALIHERERVSVDELSALLDSSHETLRRDLGLLADAGRIRKYHGGATLPDFGQEGPFAQRMLAAVQEKRAIAQVAAQLFGQGDTIFVDTGTTTLIFAQALARRPGVTVITNGIEIGRVIADAGGKVFIVGGEYRPELGEMVGPLAVEQIERFHAAHAVLTAGAIGVGGPMDFELEEAQVARAMIRQARSVTILADASKFDKAALFQLCPLARISRLVIDRPPGGELAGALAAAGVEVLIAPESGNYD